MRRLWKRLVCCWYGHNWMMLGHPCTRLCCSDLCLRCGAEQILHAADPDHCPCPNERT